MKNTFLLTVLLTLMPLTALGEEGLATLPSAHSVSATVDRLESALREQGFRIFARIDHASGAASVDMALPPTELLVFGNPRVGTQLMQANRTIGIDLPMKYLVWEEPDRGVTVGWNEGAWLADRHGVDTDAPVVRKVSAALRRFASEAAR